MGAVKKSENAVLVRLSLFLKAFWDSYLFFLKLFFWIIEFLTSKGEENLEFFELILFFALLGYKRKFDS